MPPERLQPERARNLWTSFARKFPPLEKSSEMNGQSEVAFDRIGGLAAPKEELLTYACAVTSPEVYDRWGTFPPSGLLLIGQRACGKRLLAAALASQTGTSFLHVRIPRLVMETLRAEGKVGEMVAAWSQTLEEMPPTTVLLDELEFSQAHEFASQRPDLPIGPIMDFLLDLVDRTVAVEGPLLVGSTSHPDTLRPAFLAPGRFERVVEVNPVFPDDVIAALVIHAADASQRAGRPLFTEIDWPKVVEPYRGLSIGSWVRILHAVLRRKARCDAAGEATDGVETADLVEEAALVHKAQRRLSHLGEGTYL